MKLKSQTPLPSSGPAQPRCPRRAWGVWLGGAALAAGVFACGTVSRTVVAPPGIPGATFVGSTTCADCHETIVKEFRTASHARLQAKGANALEAGCESCHGPGSLHSESGGETRLIINPKKSPVICFNCHLDKRGEFNLPYHHPVPEQRVSCGDCHDPHHGPAVKAGGTALQEQNETCYACHANQRGPYVFEHEAMREGCVSCHRPHGSVNAKLLTERNATLCFKCHFRQQTAAGQVLIGGFDHTTLLPQGTCWSAGCHEAVHGSQVNSHLRY